MRALTRDKRYSCRRVFLAIAYDVAGFAERASLPFPVYAPFNVIGFLWRSGVIPDIG